MSVSFALLFQGFFSPLKVYGERAGKPTLGGSMRDYSAMIGMLIMMNGIADVSIALPWYYPGHGALKELYLGAAKARRAACRSK